MLELAFTGLVLEFNDPVCTINALFSSKIDGWASFQQTNDTLIQQWMEGAMVETNETVREQLYYNIQKRLIEEIYPLAWLYSPVYYDVISSNVRGWPSDGTGCNLIQFENLYFA